MIQKLIICILVISSFSCKEENKIVEITSEKVIITEVEKDTIKPKAQIKNNFILGKFDYKTHPDFIKVSAKHSAKIVYLQKEVYNAFLKMDSAAKLEGVNLKIISGTRNFEEQKVIWNRKWKRNANLSPINSVKKILEYSSMPSTSRHHWGTDMDLNNLTNYYFNSGEGKKTYDWLTKNGNDYGFYQVYTDKVNGRTGYNLERWHWSYLPLASKYLEAYNSQITYQDITGFEGSEFAEDVKMISDYVNGISEKAKNYK